MVTTIIQVHIQWFHPGGGNRSSRPSLKTVGPALESLAQPEGGDPWACSVAGGGLQEGLAVLEPTWNFTSGNREETAAASAHKARVPVTFLPVGSRVLRTHMPCWL